MLTIAISFFLLLLFSCEALNGKTFSFGTTTWSRVYKARRRCFSTAQIFFAFYLNTLSASIFDIETRLDAIIFQSSGPKPSPPSFQRTNKGYRVSTVHEIDSFTSPCVFDCGKHCFDEDNCISFSFSAV